MCKVYTPFQTENHTLWGNTYMYLFDGRVRKYTQFGIFYAKIADSTEVTEGVTSTPKIFGNKHSLSLPFSQQIQFTF